MPPIGLQTSKQTSTMGTGCCFDMQALYPQPAIGICTIDAAFALLLHMSRLLLCERHTRSLQQIQNWKNPRCMAGCTSDKVFSFASWKIL